MERCIILHYVRNTFVYCIALYVCHRLRKDAGEWRGIAADACTLDCDLLMGTTRDPYWGIGARELMGDAVRSARCAKCCECWRPTSVNAALPRDGAPEALAGARGRLWALELALPSGPASTSAPSRFGLASALIGAAQRARTRKERHGRGREAGGLITALRCTAYSGSTC